MDFKLERDAWQRLVLVEPSGHRTVGVEAVRAFPLSDPEHAISIVDAEGREILFIAALSDLPAATRAVVEEELAQREFVPVIERILNSPPDSEPAEWQVITDRGPTTFQLESADNVHRRQTHEITIIDSLGTRYRIPDARRLDSHTRHVLERFL